MFEILCSLGLEYYKLSYLIVNDFYSLGNFRVSVRRLGDIVWKED